MSTLRSFLGGLALLLYGMHLLETGVTHTVDQFQTWIHRYTHGTWRSIVMGVLASAVLQSSSIVSLIVLSFVGAGMILLPDAVGMIIGANVGSTFTELIIGLVGFKLKISAIALPLIAIGGLGVVFGRSRSKWYQLILSLGLMFFGIGMLKESVEVFSTLVSLSEYIHLPSGVFVIIGLVMAALLHSAGTVTLITFAAVYGQIITFEIGVMLVAGANIGHLVVPIWGSLHGSAAKKQVTLSHALFNIILSILVWISIAPITTLMLDRRGLRSNPVAAIAIFQTLYKCCGAVIFGMGLSYFVKLIEMIIPSEASQQLAIEMVEHSSGLVAKQALQSDMNHLTTNILAYYDIVLHASMSAEAEYDQYKKIKQTAQKLFVYASQLGDIQTAHQVNHLVYAIKYIEDIEHNLASIAESSHPLVMEYHAYLMAILQQLQSLIQSDDSIGLQSLIKRIGDDDEKFVQKFAKDTTILSDASGLFIISIHRYFYQSCKSLVMSREEV